MLHQGILKDGEICPGVSWKDHAESVAMFCLRGTEYDANILSAETQDVLLKIDGDLNEPI